MSLFFAIGRGTTYTVCGRFQFVSSNIRVHADNDSTWRASDESRVMRTVLPGRGARVSDTSNVDMVDEETATDVGDSMIS
jgi:hypothetical protein